MVFNEPTEPGNTGPWLVDHQSRDLNNEFWLVVVPPTDAPVTDEVSVKINLNHYIAHLNQLNLNLWLSTSLILKLLNTIPITFCL